jgi:hypothetical protein
MKKRVRRILLVFGYKPQEAIARNSGNIRWPRSPRPSRDRTKVEGVSRDTIVRTYYRSIDSPAKQQIYSDLEKGDARIVIRTDAFGIGIDIDDVEKDIQWQVCNKLAASTLSQRFGRAGPDPKIEAVAILYVSKVILDTLGKPWHDEMGKWADAWSEIVEDPADIDMTRFEDYFANLRVMPNTKGANLARFGIPVRQDTVK